MGLSFLAIFLTFSIGSLDDGSDDYFCLASANSR